MLCLEILATGKVGAPEAVRCLNMVFNHDSRPESSTDRTLIGENEMEFCSIIFLKDTGKVIK